jgi:hypothetical protein
MLALLALAVVPVRVASAPVIDGQLGDAAWATVPAVSAFTQKTPDDGAAPTEATELRIAYDDTNVYVAIDCPQHARPIAILSRRDRQVETDRVAISLDTRHDGKSAVHFEVSAAGSLADGLRFDDTELSWEWDGNWEAQVARRADGWSAEIRIPLSLLRPTDDAAQIWGVQVRRYVVERGEVDELAYIPRDAGGEVSRYASVGPFERLRRPLGIELQPFALAKAEHTDAFEPGGAFGLDARLRVTPQLAVDVAVLPDFGQVEADEVVLQLDNIETFFPEKRPFFLQGMDLFTTPHSLLYTRRIGIDAPILGAAKLTGNVGDATSIGSMVAVTEATDATMERPAEPMTVYSATRARRDLGERAALGVFGGAVSRIDGGARDAYVGGADAWWRSADGDWTGTADVFASRIEGGDPVQLADGTTIASGDTAPGGRLIVGKEGGRWIGELDAEVIGRHADLNDLGYLARQNLARFFVAAGQHDTEVGTVLRDRREQLEVYGRANLDGLHLASGYQINSSGTFTNFWEYFVELHYRPAHYDDREFGDGTALERAGLWGLELSFGTDPHRALALSSSSTLQLLPGRGHFIESGAKVTAHVSGQLELELEPSIIHTDGEPRAIGMSPTGDWLLGEQRAVGLGAVLRATYAFTPHLTLQAFGQVFTDTVDYHSFSTAPGSADRVRLAELMTAPDPTDDPDEDGASLASTVVLRWEWRLGSTAFLVYSRAQERGGGPASDAVLFKFSYFWAH